jgi:glycosyltransferase involved in cell wall biosynthesis
MDILVDIALVTYNQAKYIAQSIESVLLQKTDFNYRLIIGEDCSSDETSEICIQYQKRFPEKILVITSNANCGLLLNYKKVFDACTAKYIAILEGDDYWTDPFKLQKQVDILEHNEEIGLVHTDYDRLDDDGNLILSFKEHNRIKPVNGYVFNQLLKENFITSITSCFRRELFVCHVDYNKFIEEQLFTIDYSIWLELSYHSRVQYIENSTAVYRVLRTSLTNKNEFSSKELYYNKDRKIKKYYLSKYPSSDITSGYVDKVYDTGLLIWAIKLKNHKKAIEYFNKAIENRTFYFLLKPFVVSPWLFRILTGLSGVNIKRMPLFRNQSFREFLNLR